jgi:hypothetical protein
MTPLSLPARAAIGGLLGLLLLPASPAGAIDGDSLGFGASTYYEGVVGGDSASSLESSDSGVPTRLSVSDSSATVAYSSVARQDGRLEWTASIRGFSRPTERVEAVYHVIAILPLPVDAQGRSLATPAYFGIVPREGTPQASVPLIYSGEKVVLKRSHALERTLLPSLIGSASGQLPSLAGTGYGYTFWDAIVRYDPAYGDTLQSFVDFQYTTDPGVAAPDAMDERLKAYVVTWIPALDPSVPPYAVRLDVVDAQ